MPITDLPAELLTLIFQQLKLDDSTQQRYADGTNAIKAAARVNRMWNSLAVPVLYHEVKLSTDFDEEESWPALSLLLLLQTKPSYCQYIRRLELYFENTSIFELHIVKRLLEKCGMINILCLKGDVECSEHCEILMDHVKMLNLRNLTLKDQCGVMFLIRMIGDALPISLNFLKVEDSDDGLDFELPSVSVHANVEHLSIDADFWSFESVGHLMSWPTHLKTLQYRFNTDRLAQHEDEEYSAMLFVESLLAIQRDSLQHIELLPSHHNAMGRYVLDFSSYTSLKYLRIPKDSVMKSDSKEVSSKLPIGLQKLELDLWTTSDPYTETIPLDEANISWLEDFSTIRKQANPDHELKSIKINFEFNDEAITHCDLTGYIEEEEWPCQSLDDAASLLRLYGVELTYPKPYIEKEAWSEMIANQTVPGWEYHSTKDERMMVEAASVGKDEHFRSGEYIHGYGFCQRIVPLPDESIEPTQLTENDGQDCGKICTYFNSSCSHEHPIRRVARIPESESEEAAAARWCRNRAKGFKVQHDCLFPQCARTIAQEYRWEEMCDQTR